MKLSLNTGFLVNRYPTPSQWAKIIHNLGVKHIQLTSDLFSPFYDESILDDYVKEINLLKEKYDFSVTSVFTGGFTRVNHFCHPDFKVRRYWMDWFKKFADYAVKLGASRLGSHIGIMSIEDNASNREIFQKQCVDCWKELAEYAFNLGMKELTWEHMSIEREQGHTRNDIDNLIEQLKGSKIPIKLCLDPDHGDLTSSNELDYEPYGLVESYLPYSSQLHLKQTSMDKRKNSTFTEKNNNNGLIVADRIVKLINEGVSDDQKKDFEIILELNAREREPDDSNICNEIGLSLDYWRKSLDNNNIFYE